jgi:surfeit locus 1 family protein
MTRGARSLLLPALTTAALVAIFVSLGLWQTRRLHEKEALIERIETRARAAPQDLPPRAQWSGLKPEEYEFRRAAARGRFLASRPALFFAHPPEGVSSEPGYVVATPFELAEGGVVLIERGFVPASKSNDPAVLAPPEGETTVSGVLRAPQSRNAFTPKDDAARGVFYTRDPTAVAAWSGVEGLAPFTLALDAAAGPQRWPRPLPAAPQITNNHLSYALTWFGLTGAIIVIFTIYARGVLSPRRQD